MKKFGVLLMGLVVCVGFASIAQAALIEYTYSGNFTYQNDILRFEFVMDEPGTVTMFSSSWISSNNSNYGFDPILAIWDASGNLIQQQDDGGRVGTTSVNGVDYSHGTYDSYFTIGVDAGLYVVTIGAYNNWANSTNLSDGFSFDNYTPVLITEWSQPANGYRGSQFVFHILGVNEVTPPSPAVPIPGTALLMGWGLAGLAAYARRRKS